MSSLTESRSALAARHAASRARNFKRFGVLAGMIAATLLSIFFWQASVLAPPSPQEVKSEETVAKPEQISAENASIAGRDKNERPFQINARSGEQDKQQSHIVHMSTVTSTFERANGSALDVTSDQGRYDRKSKALELTGNVVFSEGVKFKALMEKAAINTDDQSLASRSPVKVDMQGTMIEAGSLTVTDNGTHIVFKGGVKAKFKAN